MNENVLIEIIDSLSKAAQALNGQQTFSSVEMDSLRHQIKELSDSISDPQLLKELATQMSKTGLVMKGDGNIIGSNNVAFVFKTERYYRLVGVLEELAEKIRSDETAAAELLLQEYRVLITDKYRYLQTFGIPKPGGVTVEIELDEIFIRLRTELENERVDRYRKVLEMSEAEDQGPSGQVAEAQRKRQERQKKGELDPDIIPMPIRFALQKVFDTTETQKSVGIVILGEAGSGKSTLLRYLARKFAQGPGDGGPNDETLGYNRIPLFVSLRDFALNLSRNKKTDIVQFAISQASSFLSESNQDRLEKILHDKVRRGEVVFLFDALDEARDHRIEVSRCIEEANRSYLGNWTIVTSRPVGYEVAKLDRYVHYYLVELAKEQAKEFVDRWFEALAKAENRLLSQAWAHQRAVWLWEQIEDQQNPILSAAATNPLLLTFLSVLASQESPQPLPDSRAELYRQYLENLFKTWEWRNPESPFVIAGLDQRRTQKYCLIGLYQLALWLHHSYFGRGGTPNRITAQAILAKWVETQGGKWDRISSEVIAEDILAFWIKAGLLDTYDEYIAFRHLTFQEYCAARAISKKDTEEYNEFFRLHLHNPAWREVFLLTSASLNDSTEFIRIIYELHTHELESVVYRDLLLAAHCIAESTQVAQALAKHVIDDLIKCGLEGSVHVLAVDSAIALGRISLRMHNRSRALSNEINARAVEIAIDRKCAWWNRLAAINILGMMPTINVRAMPAILMATKSRREDLKIAAIRALKSIALNSSETVKVLLLLLKDNSRNVKAEAALALLPLHTEYNEILEALVIHLSSLSKPVKEQIEIAFRKSDADGNNLLERLVRQTDNKKTLITMSQLLGRTTNELREELLQKTELVRRDGVSFSSVLLMGVYKPEFVKGLLENANIADISIKGLWRLRRDFSGLRLYSPALNSLERIVELEPRVLEDLSLELTGPHIKSRIACAAILLKHSHNSKESIRVLIAALDNKFPEIRQLAATWLVYCGHLSENVILKLIEASAAHTSDMHWDTGTGVNRKRARVALLDAQKINPKLVELAILAGLQSQDWRMRAYTARICARQVKLRSSMIEKLLICLKDKNHLVRAEAVDALGAIERPSRDLSNAILRLSEDKKPNVRHKVTEVLERWGIAAPNMIKMDLRELENEELDIKIQKKIIQRLGSMGGNDERVITKLISLLESSTKDLRISSAAALAKIKQGRPEVVSALRQMCKDDDDKVSLAAASALVELGQVDTDLFTMLVKKIETKNAALGAKKVIAKLGVLPPDVLQALVNVILATPAISKNDFSKLDLFAGVLQRQISTDASVIALTQHSYNAVHNAAYYCLIRGITQRES